MTGLFNLVIGQMAAARTRAFGPPSIDGCAATAVYPPGRPSPAAPPMVGGKGAANSSDEHLEAALSKALERDEFALHYQPQVCLDSGRIVAVEALLRWNSAELGRVPPDRFIPIAERTGEIRRVGEWVLHEACAQHSRWRATGVQAPRVAVNVSPVQLSSPDFPARVGAIVKGSKMRAEALELELTASQILGDDDAPVRALEALRAQGVSIALDDFGAGFLSLMHLKRMRVDTLKIDRAFVRNLAEDSSNAAIVAGIISIGRGLGLRIVAEGVESERELAFLRDRECHHVQGCLTGRPEPADEISLLLRAGGVMCRGRQTAALYC